MKKQFKNLFPYLIVIFGLVLTGMITFCFYLLLSPEKKDLPLAVNQKSSEKIVAGSDNPVPSASSEAKITAKVLISVTPKPVPVKISPSPVPSQTPSPVSQGSVQTSNQKNTSTPAPVQNPKTNLVNLEITGISGFSVSIDEGTNQCDVLNKALADKKISSLNMKFDSNLGTYGVYQINGLGKENSVWWTYKVNGQSPSQGCSFVKAKDNDSVKWEYIGS